MAQLKHRIDCTVEQWVDIVTGLKNSMEYFEDLTKSSHPTLQECGRKYLERAKSTFQMVQDQTEIVLVEEAE